MRYTAAVITISDKGYRGERSDTSGPALCARLTEAGWEIVYQKIIPDEGQQIQSQLRYCADELQAALILTTGGTGFSPRDVTPEATNAVIQREAPGIAETMRAASVKITPRGCLSRGVAGIRQKSLIINLPGSQKAALENLDAVIDPLRHGIDMLYSAGSADCGNAAQLPQPPRDPRPSPDQWLREAKEDPASAGCGAYLIHSGAVRQVSEGPCAEGRLFSYDGPKLEAAIQRVRAMPGIGCVRVWMEKGPFKAGDDAMMALVGGDTFPRAAEALRSLMDEIEQSCIIETERRK